MRTHFSFHRQVTVAAFAVAAAAPLGAQAASVAVHGGSATDINGNASRAVTLVPTWTFGAPGRLASLSGIGTRFEQSGWSIGGAGAASLRREQGRFGVGVDLAGDLARTSFDASYGTLSAIPAATFTAGPLTLQGGVAARRAMSSIDVSATRSPFGPSRQSHARSALTAIAGATLRLDDRDGGSLILGFRDERGTVADAAQSEQTATITVAQGRVALLGSYAMRSRAGDRTSVGSGALSVTLTGSASLIAAAGRYAANPMTGAAAGSFTNIGLSYAFGRATPALPRPAGTGAPARGTTRLSIRAPDAERVELAGDFTRWALRPARRAPNGVWYLDLAIPAGTHRYAFRIDGKEWRVPDGAPAASDDFGGTSAWVTVRSDSSTTPRPASR